MLRAYKFKLYPTDNQKKTLVRCFGHSRFVWNKNVEYFNNKEKCPSTTELKKEFEFLNEVSAAILQQKERDFIEFKRQFFNKNRKIKLNFPKFK